MERENAAAASPAEATASEASGVKTPDTRAAREPPACVEEPYWRRQGRSRPELPCAPWPPDAALESGTIVTGALELL